MVGFAVEAWAAHRLLGWDGRLARQAVVVCWTICLIFIPLLYRAYEIRFRKRNPKTLLTTLTAFLGALFLEFLYYFDRTVMSSGDQTVRWLTIGITLIAFTAGVLFSVYGVRCEIE